VRPTVDEPPATTLAAFRLTDAAAQLAAITGADPKEFTADRFRVRAYPIMTLIVSEGFFANAVGVVEGMTEAGALWKISEVLGESWIRKGIVIIPAGGKTAIDKPLVIFHGFKIPTYVLFDGDKRHEGKPKEEEHTKKLNRHCLKVAGVPDAQLVDFPSLTITESWGCFEDTFEAHCQQELGSATFEQYRKEVAEEFGYDRPAEAMKNFDVAAAFIERVYAAGHRLPKLEEIVKRISALAP